MDRSLYPSQVVVQSTDLQNTETTKALHIQRRHIDVGSAKGGRVSGLTIAASGSTQFTVGPGYGYTPRGDLILLDEETDGVNLAVYTAGVVNYAIAVYKETPSGAREHETAGTTENTRTTGYAEIQCILKTEYDALPTVITGDKGIDLQENLESSNLEALSLDRILYLGSIETDDGATVDADAITQSDVWSDPLTASFNAAQTITGVNLRALSSDTPIGTDGNLTWDESAGDLNWAAPGESLGSGVTVTGLASGATATLTSSGGSTLTVQVFPEFFPDADQSDDITVSYLYDALGEPWSTRDQAHRAIDGSALPTASNPHGFGPEDFYQQILNFVQTMKLGGDYIDTALKALLPRLSGITSSTIRTEVFEFGPAASTTASRWRVYYCPQLKRIEMTMNAKCTAASATSSTDTWILDDTGADAMRIALGQPATSVFTDPGLVVHRRDSSVGSSWADSAWTDTVLPLVGSVILGAFLNSNTTDLIKPRIVIDPTDNTGGAGVTRRLVLSNASTNGSVNIYFAENGTGSDNKALELCFNALATTSGWTNPVASELSARISIGLTGVRVLTRAASATTTWSDAISSGNWVEILSVTDAGVTVTALTAPTLTATSSIVAPNAAKANGYIRFDTNGDLVDFGGTNFSNVTFPTNGLGIIFEESVTVPYTVVVSVDIDASTEILTYAGHENNYNKFAVRPWTESRLSTGFRIFAMTGKEGDDSGSTYLINFSEDDAAGGVAHSKISQVNFVVY